MVTQLVLAALMTLTVYGAVRCAGALDRRGIIVGMMAVTIGIFVALWYQTRDTLFLWSLFAGLFGDLILFVHSGHTKLLPARGASVEKGRMFTALALWAVATLAIALLWVVWRGGVDVVFDGVGSQNQALRLIASAYWKEGFAELVCGGLLVLSVLIGSMFMVERDGENQ